MRHEPAAEASAILRRFSNFAVAGTAVLLASGLVLAAVQLGGIEGLFGTGYGLRLSSKLALVAVLLLLAAVNRLRSTPAFAAGKASARRDLRRTIAGEVVVVVGILSLSAMLGQAIPPRALRIAEEARHGAAAEAGFSVTLGAEDARALVDVQPARPGQNGITIHLFGADGPPLTAHEVTIELSEKALGIEPIRRTAKPIAPGVYRYEGPEMTLAGDWTLRIYVLVSDFKRIRFETTLPVRNSG